MACEDIELRLSNLRGQKRDLEEDLDPDGPPPLSRENRASLLRQTSTGS